MNYKRVLMALTLVTMGPTVNAMKNQAKAGIKRAEAAAKQPAKTAAAITKKVAPAVEKQIAKLQELPLYIKNDLVKSITIDVYIGGPESEDVTKKAMTTAKSNDAYKKIASFELNSKEYRLVGEKIKVAQTYLVKITPKGEPATGYHVRHTTPRTPVEIRGFAVAVQEIGRQILLTKTALPKENIAVPSVLSLQIWRAKEIPAEAQEQKTTAVSEPTPSMPTEPTPMTGGAEPRPEQQPQTGGGLMVSQPAGDAATGTMQ